MNITPNFSFAGMVATQVRTWIAENARYATAWIVNLRRLCVNLLEPCREILGNVPMIVTSGVRCPGLNAAVGGSPTSAHMYGLAVDFIAPAFGSPYMVACKLVAELRTRGIRFDQIIYEHTWVHISIEHPSGEQRGQVLTLMEDGSYKQGIILRGAPA